MSYIIFADIISRLHDLKRVDPWSTLIHVSAYGPKATVFTI